MAERNSIKAILVIAERGKGKGLAEWMATQGVFLSYQCSGLGTASSELLDVLGVGSAEKDILLSLTGCVNADKLLAKIGEEEMGTRYGNGIVCSMPVTGLNSIIATVFLHEQDGRTGGNRMEEQTENSLILIAVNQGHTDEVMDTARQAGARGGTIIRARWAGTEESGQFYGISLQAEKEIIAIVASSSQRNAIMEIVNKKHGLQSQAGAVICSLGIDRMVKWG